MKGKLKRPSLDETLAVLYNGFVKGGGGFLKAGGAADLLKSGTGASRECRVGVTQVSLFLEYVFSISSRNCDMGNILA